MHAHVPQAELDVHAKRFDKTPGINTLRKKIFLCFLLFPPLRGWDPAERDRCPVWGETSQTRSRAATAPVSPSQEPQRLVCIN